MGKDKKLNGWNWDLFISEDEKLVATCNNRNGVYVYDLETGGQIFKAKTVSYVAKIAISPNKKYLAAKNTSGMIAILSMENGEEICRNKMAETEGYPMIFTDEKCLLDFDQKGRTMLLDIENNFRILDDIIENDTGYSPFAYLHYDRFSKNIYKIVDRGREYKTAVALVSASDPNSISYKVIRQFSGPAPDCIKGISFCRDHIYYLDADKKHLVVTDKDFTETTKLQLPFKKEEAYRALQIIRVSPCEKYLFVYLGGNMSGLFELSSMKLIREFEYYTITDFKMIDEDRRYIISTWDGSYLGDV